MVFDHGLATYQAIYLVYNIRISDTYMDTYPAPIFQNDPKCLPVCAIFLENEMNRIRSVSTRWTLG